MRSIVFVRMRVVMPHSSQLSQDITSLFIPLSSYAPRSDVYCLIIHDVEHVPQPLPGLLGV
jgi:hypothetical protein